MNRKQTLAAVKENPRVTVLIIGAGINGIGTFRDLALQGVNCLIIDRGDFCSGASMASSHMVHGGLRYLENGEFRLVREALHERNNLLRNAPHLTYPLPTTIPIFKWFSGILNAPLKFIGLLNKPAERGAVIIKLGLMLYDSYVRGDSPMPGHRFNNQESSLANWPELNPEIQFTATYYDGAMVSPERLALEILMDGEAEGDHARVLNYVSAVETNGSQVVLRDEISGEGFLVEPEIIVNAGGPWIDLINQKINGKSNFIGGTKGSHLILDNPQLRKAIGDHEIFFEYLDGRIVLIFPYLEDHVLIGSTDLRIEDPDQAYCTNEEIDYILGMVPQIFPSLHVSREQIVFQFSGVRPLPAARGSTGQISRDHSIEIIEKSAQIPWPILNLVGGKWTSYRAFSEQVADQILSRLSLPRKENTSQLAIGGGKEYPVDERMEESWIKLQAERSGLSQERVRQLFKRYGTQAGKLAAALSGESDFPLKYVPEYTRAEVMYLAKEEMITRLDDFFLRRTKLAWAGRVSLESICEVADIIGQVHKWEDSTQREEVACLLKILRERHGMKYYESPAKSSNS